MSIQTTAQKRSGDAFLYVQAVAQGEYDNAIKDKYKARVKDFPTMVLSNGLLQALSFVFSKKKDKDYELIGEHVNLWIGTAISNGWIPGPQADHSVDCLYDTIKWLTSVNTSTYLTVTGEVLNFAPWLKRFAEGMIQSQDDHKGEANAG